METEFGCLLMRNMERYFKKRMVSINEKSKRGTEKQKETIVRNIGKNNGKDAEFINAKRAKYERVTYLR